MNNQSIDINTALKDLQHYKLIQKNLDDQIKIKLQEINQKTVEKLILTNKLRELTDKTHELETKYKDFYKQIHQLKSEETNVIFKKLIVKKQLDKIEKITNEQKETKADCEMLDLVALEEIHGDLLSQVAKNKIEIEKKLHDKSSI